jgi:hypothetical protein
MESDDDLPPPPPKAPAAFELEDDLDLPPPPAPVAAVQLSDSEEEEDMLPPPPSAVSGPPVLVDSDDDLPPPPLPKQPQHVDPATAKDDAPPPAPNQTQATANNDDSPRAKDPSAAAAAAAEATKPRATSVVRQRATTLAASPARGGLFKEGWVWKQSPTWPYTTQKRWFVLKGRMLAYYETPGGTGATPISTLDLKGAKFADVKKTAKWEHSFGLTGPLFPFKDRVYIFSLETKDDLQLWKEMIDAVSAVDETNKTELHWFEKMAQGEF